MAGTSLCHDAIAVAHAQPLELTRLISGQALRARLGPIQFGRGSKRILFAAIDATRISYVSFRPLQPRENRACPSMRASVSSAIERRGQCDHPARSDTHQDFDPLHAVNAHSDRPASSYTTIKATDDVPYSRILAAAYRCHVVWCVGCAAPSATASE